MGIIRYILKSVSILNVLLAGVIVLFLLYGLFPLLSTSVSYKLSSGRKTPLEAPSEKVQSPQVPSPADYAVVAENNLFHPDRKIPTEKKDDKQPTRPELVLYGTVITSDLSAAYVEDKKAPYTTPGRGKRPQVMRKGDTIGGFVLKDIEPHRITLVRNEEIMTVSLDTTKVREEVGRGPQPTPQTAGQRPALSPPPAAPAPGQAAAASPVARPPQGAAVPAPTTPQMPQRPVRLPSRQ